MREYYIKHIDVYGEDFKYVRGAYDDYDNINITVGDFNNSQYEECYYIRNFAIFSRTHKVTGCMDRNGSFEFIKYRQEFKEFEKYIIGYTYTSELLDRTKSFKYIQINSKAFKRRCFSVERSFIHSGEPVPISVADYIINYAEAEDFSEDLKYVYCPMENEGVVKFMIDVKGRALLAKLRLLR